MDCKDLTICDFVKHDGIIKIVDAVYLYSVSVHDPSEPWGVAKSELVSVDDIEPIKLTEDILVKNGFVKTWNGDWQFKEYSTIIISKDYYVNIFERSIRIDYIHELQHLLHATCVDKELVID